MLAVAGKAGVRARKAAGGDRGRAGKGQRVKAVVCPRYGPPEVLRVEDVPMPVPRRNQVRIRVAATAVTSGGCYLPGLDLPARYRVPARLALGLTGPRRRILGMVLAGEVESAGADVTAFGQGDQVFGLDRHLFGACAEYACWPQDTVLAAMPGGLRYEEAAAIPYGGLLALHFLRRAGVRGGERVAVYGASGAVGTSAVQLARHFGADVTGVCSGANLALVRSLGAATVIDYTVDFTQNQQPYDVIFDAAGKRKSAAALRQARRALVPGGICIPVDDGTPKLLAKDLTLLKELAETKAIRPVIDRCYRLEQMAGAHRYVDGRHKKGNVVVTVST